jgi:nitroimidazol reductase NimA-like FMN-containing flavoprotein (pyridoxamine 5'-phosphate oxidase superfamily)
MLGSCEFGVLSTVGDDGYPYGVPVSFTYSGGVIYFHSAKEGHKLDNIKHDGRVSFCVVGFAQVQPKDFTASFESAIAFGRAHVVEGEEKRRALLAIAVKYTDRSTQEIEGFINDEGVKATVMRIDLESVTAKGSTVPSSLRMTRSALKKPSLTWPSDPIESDTLNAI